jgi:hypothetical protein
MPLSFLKSPPLLLQPVLLMKAAPSMAIGKTLFIILVRFSCAFLFLNFLSKIYNKH